MTSYESSPSAQSASESYNPWSVVHLVFHHLAEQGLHPVLGDSGDPGGPAAALLIALGIEPTPEGNRQIRASVRSQLGDLRAAFFGPDTDDSGTDPS